MWLARSSAGGWTSKKHNENKHFELKKLWRRKSPRTREIYDQCNMLWRAKVEPLYRFIDSVLCSAIETEKTVMWKHYFVDDFTADSSSSLCCSNKCIKTELYWARFNRPPFDLEQSFKNWVELIGIRRMNGSDHKQRFNHHLNSYHHLFRRCNTYRTCRSSSRSDIVALNVLSCAS